MGMHWIDWLIVVGLLAVLVSVAVGTQRLTHSVADFLAANRLAGRYLLTMASGMAGLGAISIAANFEKFYEAGFAGLWWGQVVAPIMLILALSGFVIYRYRETRVLTMSQFFEVRYSRRFRIFTGVLAFLSGVLNYGIFPAVTARFLVYFTGLPPELDVLGFTMPTIAPVMAIMLSLALALTLSGGQIAVMITDFLQGQFTQITILVIFAFLMWHIGWGDLMEGLRQAPEQASRINPFKQGETKGFDPFFFFMLAALNVYGFKAWQGSQGYNASARTPHEAKMAGILGEFRAQVVFLLVMLLPVFIYAVLQLPQYADTAGAITATLSGIEDETIRTQMRVPVGLGELLPVGVMGMFACVVIAAAISTDDTYLHSWGSIFIQDVVMPFRRKPLSPRMHMLLLRGAIVGVAVFAFFFSLLFPLNEYIFMYFQITGAIYLGGAGAVILGGLYWNRGTVEGAWAAMITGSVLAVTGIVLRNIAWPVLLPGVKEALGPQSWAQSLPEKFPLNGMQMSFGVAILAVLVYIVVSLLSRRPPVNMDKLLHRGQWALEEAGHKPEQVASPIGPVPAAPARDLSPRERFWRWIGVTEVFTRGDKAIYLFKIAWTMFFFIVFIIGTLLGLTVGISDAAWELWWAIKVTLSVIVGVVATVWFLIGGVHDLIALVRDLLSVARDTSDDGWVREDEHLQEDGADGGADLPAASRSGHHA